MTDAGFFRGTSSEQDNRFSDKEKKLLKQMKFAENLTTKVEMNKIKLDVIKPWISKRISELLGMEDDVVAEFVINQLEAEKSPDARKIQINLTGFLNGKNARIFMGELWGMLISAQENASGIPAALVEAKKEEIRKRNEDLEALKRTVSHFTEKIKDEKSSPPPVSRRDRSSSRDRDSRRSKPSEESKSREEGGVQSKRNYRSRRSASGSPEGPSRKRSRSRSDSRERNRRGGGRPSRDNSRERDRGDRRGGGGGDRYFKARRSRSPVGRRNRSRSRSPYRGRSSPRPVRRRSPYYESRSNRNDTNYRDAPVRRNSSPSDRDRGDRYRNRQDGPRRRSRSQSPGKGDRLSVTDKDMNIVPVPVSSSPAAEKSAEAEIVEKSVPENNNHAASPSSSGSDSSPENGASKSAPKSKGSGASSDEESDKKQKKDKKKKKDKKHKKHKKQKKLKKTKDHDRSKGSSDDESDSEGEEGKKNGSHSDTIMPNEKMAESFRSLVSSNAPPGDDLEQKLREKALESLKKANSNR